MQNVTAIKIRSSCLTVHVTGFTSGPPEYRDKQSSIT